MSTDDRTQTQSAENDVPETCPYDGQSLAWHLHTELDPRGNPRTNAAFIGCQWPAELDGLAAPIPPGDGQAV